MESTGPAPTAPLRLVAGLGNPGRNYAGTRHNVGFMILDRMAATAFSTSSRWKAEIAPWSVSEAGPRWLCKPMGFMNLSGAPLRQVADFYKIDPASMLVVFDDAALPLGRLRLRRSGSAGGHNGMQSIIEHFGTDRIARLRVGIGAANSSSAMVGHVLGRFSEDEKPELDIAIKRAVEAVECVASRGIEAAMNLYNQANQ